MTASARSRTMSRTVASSRSPPTPTGKPGATSPSTASAGRFAAASRRRTLRTRGLTRCSKSNLDSGAPTLERRPLCYGRGQGGVLRARRLRCWRPNGGTEGPLTARRSHRGPTRMARWCCRLGAVPRNGPSQGTLDRRGEPDARVPPHRTRHRTASGRADARPCRLEPWLGDTPSGSPPSPPGLVPRSQLRRVPGHECSRAAWTAAAAVLVRRPRPSSSILWRTMRSCGCGRVEPCDPSPGPDNESATLNGSWTGAATSLCASSSTGTPTDTAPGSRPGREPQTCGGPPRCWSR